MAGMTADLGAGKMPGANPGDTWPQVLTYNYQTYGDRRIAVRYKYRGVWRSLTWKDYYLQVKNIALGLLALGFGSGDRILIIGDNAPPWYCTELAAQANHGAAIGVHPDASSAEIKAVLERTTARFILVQNQEQVDKLSEIKDELSLLRKIIYWNYKGLAHYKDPILIGYRELEQLGQNCARERPNQFSENVVSGKSDDVCAIDAAGVALTYSAIRNKADQYLQSAPWLAQDTALPYLPPLGAAEQCLGIACHLLSACKLSFTESPETHRRDARELAPSLVYQPARLWESQANLVQARILEADALKRLAYRIFKPVGDRMAETRSLGREPSVDQKLLYALASFALFRPIRASLGLERVRLSYSHGTRLSSEAARFYGALNLHLQDLCAASQEENV